MKDGVANSASRRPKQRYKCVSPAGTRHVFLGALPRDRAPSVQTCYACGNPIESHQGPATLSGSGYQIVEVVHALLDIAAGMTYTEAALRARTRYKGAENLKDTPTRSGSTVANWVDAYAPILLDHFLPKQWPDGLALDSTRFMYTNARTGQTDQLFVILAATGYEAKQQGRLWSLRAVVAENEQSWAEFFGRLDGKPSWVLYDGWPAIPAPVAKHWADKPPLLHYSEHHLYKNAKRNIKDDGQGQFQSPVMLLLNSAFQTRAGWQAFRDQVLAESEKLPKTTRWVEQKDKLIVKQINTRNLVAKYSTGGVEPVLNVVKDELKRRSWTFRNQDRMNLLLGLLQLRINRQDNAYDWVQVLTEALEKTGGKSPHNYNRDHKDKSGNPTYSLR